MKHYKLINNVVGWLTFAIAAVVYLSTIEPTASFWDCGEFISSAFKLEVGHPPGAPFFIITGRLFTLLASDPTKAAMMVNSMSALFSAFTILFLFWTITHLAKKVITQGNKEMGIGSTIAIMGAGIVGALAYTFSDTFWFSAVEGEVYAYSSFFTAIVFWCILKWEDADDKGDASRWIVLIAYLMGLSIGVHLLNLLAIPAIVLVYYFKRTEKVTFKGTILALIVSGIILLAVLYGLIPGFTKVAGKFELFAVNGLGLPFNSGLALYLILTVAAIVCTLYFTHNNKSQTLTNIAFIAMMLLLGVPFLANSIVLGIILSIALIVGMFVKQWNHKVLNLITLCAMVIMIGYSSYAMIMVRSAANPPMDQNSPEDVFSLQSYLNREQYGDRPLFYGAVYSAPETLKQEGNYCKPIEKLGREGYKRKVKESQDEKDLYISTGRQMKGYETDKRFNMLFPRMYSKQQHHIDAYKQWADVKGERISVDRCGQRETRVKPTFGENIRFFIVYQCHFMYWRYFMWNFAGRQNDIPSHGEIDHGNWISGIKFLDNARLGNQEAMPEELRNNKGHNVYYMLPLLLGIIGLAWQLSSDKKGKQQFWVTMALFFLTGLAIVIYLNQTPYQPRERDYAYAGSFYAFCIWIGLGVMGIYRILQSAKLNSSVSAAIATIACLGVPALMGAQNWDDHDRSNKYVCRDTGANYLNTSAPNSILFCNGDNDTFPVWYNQEVEGTRTDVRSCNLSYIQADWYIDQMKRGYYESAPLPINWKQSQYLDGTFDVARVTNKKEYMMIGDALEYLKDSKNQKDGVAELPTQRIIVPVDQEAAIKYGAIKEGDSTIVTHMVLDFNSMITKRDVMVLEMLYSGNWTRPMYLSSTIGSEFYPKCLQRYMQQEGMAYRIVPAERNMAYDTDIAYDNFMNKYQYGNMKDPKVYLDENTMRTCQTLRLYMGQLALTMARQGDSERALKLMDYSLQEVPIATVPASYSIVYFVEAYALCGKKDKSDELGNLLLENCVENLEWLCTLPRQMVLNVSTESSARQNLGIIQEIYLAADRAQNDQLKSLCETQFRTYSTKFQALLSK